MPLMPGKSKQAFNQNMKTELEAGKPLKQALAIAYSKRRQAQKMYKGGMAGNQSPGDIIMEHKPLLADLLERRRNRLNDKKMPYPDVDLEAEADEYALDLEEEAEREAMYSEPAEDKRQLRKKRLADLIARRHLGE